MSGLTIASKSPWHPAMRREHHFSLVASRYGYDVTFIEQPEDIRSARSHLKHYVEGLRGRVSEESSIKVMQRSVLVPGHRGKLWQHLDVWQLHRLLESTINPVVHYLPWQFGAGPSTARAVFDCTDNWLSLYPSAAAPLLQRSFAKIADEADEIIVVSPALSSLFPGREPQVIPNGVDAREIANVVAPRPGQQRLVFVGTLSERFDVAAVRALLADLPDWTLDLYGPCRFAGSGDQPSSELRRLLETSGGRVSLRGVVPKHEVSRVLDQADVLVIPSVGGFARGQSSMKLLDAAARGRPAVVSPDVTVDGSGRPPGTYVAAALEEWATAVLDAANEDVSVGESRRQWALQNTWEQRFHAWRGAVGIAPNEKELGNGH
jgi:glycosyltransferase involved in cell wall biosynthesis